MKFSTAQARRLLGFLLLRFKIHLAARGRSYLVGSFLRKYGGTETSCGNVWKNLNLSKIHCMPVAEALQWM